MSFLKEAFLCSKRGQALVELTLIFPMLLTLTLGAVEMANLIYTYQVIHHLSAQGASIAARPTPFPGEPMNDYIRRVMDGVIKAACPVISQGTSGAPNCPASNDVKWRVIYTEMGPDTSAAAPQPYIVREQRVLGSGKVVGSKRICDGCGLIDITCDPAAGSCLRPNNVPNLADIGAGQSLYAFEVFYEYSPITFLGNFVGATFADTLYERSIF